MSGLGRTSEEKKKRKPTPFTSPPPSIPLPKGCPRLGRGRGLANHLTPGGRKGCALLPAGGPISAGPQAAEKRVGGVEEQELRSLAQSLACSTPGSLSSFPQPAGQQPRPCAPLSPCPPHSSAYSGSTVASRALLGQGEKSLQGQKPRDFQIKVPDKSLAIDTQVRGDRKDVSKVKGPRPAGLHPSIAPKIWQVHSQRHVHIGPPQKGTFPPSEH